MQHIRTELYFINTIKKPDFVFKKEHHDSDATILLAVVLSGTCQGIEGKDIGISGYLYTSICTG